MASPINDRICFGILGIRATMTPVASKTRHARAWPYSVWCSYIRCSRATSSRMDESNSLRRPRPFSPSSKREAVTHSSFHCSLHIPTTSINMTDLFDLDVVLRPVVVIEGSRRTVGTFCCQNNHPKATQKCYRSSKDHGYMAHSRTLSTRSRQPPSERRTVQSEPGSATNQFSLSLILGQHDSPRLDKMFRQL